MSDLPPGWVRHESRSRPNTFYFFNTQTGETSWAPPVSETVQCLHLLQKHRGSRRPASWRNPHITITKEEAIANLREFERQLRDAERDGRLEELFRQLASENSDCSSARAGGDLGEFERGKMQKPFEEAAFALQPGEMSGVVDTDSGVHLILRLR